MPTYEYACKSCGEHLEVVQSFMDDALTECPNCGGQLRKVFGNIGISFKGSGFYKNDSRGSTSSSSSGSSSSDSASKPAGDTKSGDAKPSGESKSGGDAKPSGDSKSGGDAKPAASTGSKAAAS